MQKYFRLLNKEKLFNLHHISTHNIIEHTFSILKQCFHILLVSLEYKTEIQSKFSSA